MIKRFILRDGRVWDNLRRQAHPEIPGLTPREASKFLNSSKIFEVKPVDYLKERLKEHDLVILTECVFIMSRRWLFDGIVYNTKRNESTHIAIEIEGLRGRHQHTGGFINDMEKYNAATVYGYKLLRFTTKDLLTDYPVKCILAMLNPFTRLKEFEDFTIKKERK